MTRRPVLGHRAEQVPQQHEVVQPAHLGEHHRPGRSVRVAGRRRETGCQRVTQEERRHGQLELVDEAIGQQLPAQPRAGLHHQATRPAPCQVGEDSREPHRRGDADDLRQVVKFRLEIGGNRIGAVDEPRDLRLGGKERGIRVQGTAGGDRDPGRMLGQPAGQPGRPARRRADEQPGVVAADGGGAHHDRIRAGAFRVDPVQVGLSGHDQALRSGSVQVAVDRHRAAEQHVRAFRRQVCLPSGTRPSPRPGAVWPAQRYPEPAAFRGQGRGDLLACSAVPEAGG